MWFLAVVFMVKTNQCVREVNILNSFMFSDKKKKRSKQPYEELPFLLNSRHLECFFCQ